MHVAASVIAGQLGATQRWPWSSHRQPLPLQYVAPLTMALQSLATHIPVVGDTVQSSTHFPCARKPHGGITTMRDVLTDGLREALKVVEWLPLTVRVSSSDVDSDADVDCSSVSERDRTSDEVTDAVNDELLECDAVGTSDGDRDHVAVNTTVAVGEGTRDTDVDADLEGTSVAVDEVSTERDGVSVSLAKALLDGEMFVEYVAVRDGHGHSMLFE